MTSLGEWARRKELLVTVGGAVTAVGSAVAGLSGFVTAAGAAVAVCGVGLLVREQRAARQVEQQRHDWGMRYLGLLDKATPLMLGVDAAAQTDILPGGAIPEYVGRPQDAALQAAMGQGLSGGDVGWLVVAVGGSKTGKSRSMFEALKAAQAQAGQVLCVVAPVEPRPIPSPTEVAVEGMQALNHLLDATTDTLDTPPGDQLVLWLDDIEPWLHQGLTLDHLKRWHERYRGIVVATQGGKGAERVQHAGNPLAISDPFSEVMAAASTVPFDRLTDPGDAVKVSAHQAAEIQKHGLAAVLVAGPALEAALQTGRIAGGPACPAGVEVSVAAADWALCGRTDPIPRDVLRTLWDASSHPGLDHTDEQFAVGLDWARTPVAGTIALLNGNDGMYRAYDYAVTLIAAAPHTHQPSKTAWHAAVETASGREAFAVGRAADTAGLWGDAERAYAAAGASSGGDPGYAMAAALRADILLRRLGRSADARETLQHVVDRCGGSQDPLTRRLIGAAQLMLGVIHEQAGRTPAAIDSYSVAKDRLAAEDIDASAATKVGLCLAMLKLGRLRAETDPDHAIRTFQGSAVPSVTSRSCLSDCISSFNRG